MQWLPHHLLSLCLSGALLLAIAWGEEMYGDYAYDVSPTSDYDENSTIPFFIYSNTTNFDLEEILKGVQDDFTQEPEDQTTPPDVSTYDGAPRLTSPSLLLSLCLPLHQLCRLL
ncbi:hypothetical protein MATL_G00229150 [Megalops atlanticus]|uniref:Uncharacterized protein n=1 Tax=Megalops atlanticus TaxID=7932 RepID=A0A9D3PFT9_MEGAT|nr:hypothetical protein MATL_G00229150 [Megalops atlanticus]